MGNEFNEIKRISRNQIRNIWNIINCRSLTTTSFAATTLDMDDVQIAKNWLINRKQWGDFSIVSKFESEFMHWNGSCYAFAFMAGRIALSACIYALDLRPGDEVIIPAYTCVVVPNAFQYAGIKPVYCDIELETYGLDVELIEEKITNRTRAILIHHLYGLVCRDYEAIITLSKKHNLKVIEDCTQATGAEYKNRKVGNWGDCAIYSSEQSKVFNTIQGGIAVTNNASIADRLKSFYNKAPLPNEIWIDKQLHNVIISYYLYKHPQRWWLGDLISFRYIHKHLISTTKEEELGKKPANYGARMLPPIAALGLNQLRKLNSYNNIRRETAKLWEKWCRNNGYRTPTEIPGSTSIYLRYPILVEPGKKQDTSWAIQNPGVKPGVWFISHLHPSKRTIHGFPNADIAVNQCINFPGVFHEQIPKSLTDTNPSSN